MSHTLAHAVPTVQVVVIDKLKLPALKALCKQQGLKVGGRKSELKLRLLNAASVDLSVRSIVPQAPATTILSKLSNLVKRSGFAHLAKLPKPKVPAPLAGSQRHQDEDDYDSDIGYDSVEDAVDRGFEILAKGYRGSGSGGYGFFGVPGYGMNPYYRDH